ncbi:tRNA (uridine(34)/cytosine(34)/5-carboxymethylaminomethyluridine(34)-2'-O)-methyltransferase TrmL [Bacillus sp. Marseille-P3661]|uniref:tRNA (uridine(34)/cytosine(34)/5- carboxymethylaminomethyluridine(34)-2'-O)- methyltransferase TrmL n=1 Tax=Bacillus sp. Marseille-P3661 TaxID=1936234 RepID=UPI000C85075D|nr:tRNA (uridine(34)/cytosine(34)/5-carboxymethylaminomethyluridine(34)-2'-O)-methyltransferase TrmL [Bacillus sp. Marseille-P3661]
MSIHIVLYQPEIPSNTGNIARTCAATNTVLHLIHPLGFSTEDKMLKRAGLDYWDSVEIRNYDSLEIFLDQNKHGKFFYLTKFGKNKYTDFDFSNSEEEIYFVFGRETTGLPKQLIEENPQITLRVPMTDKVRSLNLSNTAAILVYEALRQQNYPGLT